MSMISQQILQDVESLPPHLQEEALDFVRFLKLKQDAVCKENMAYKKAQLAQLLKEIAKRGTAFAQVDDPVSWQKELREDRTLPGRE